MPNHNPEDYVWCVGFDHFVYQNDPTPISEDEMIRRVGKKGVERIKGWEEGTEPRPPFEWPRVSVLTVDAEPEVKVKLRKITDR